MLMSAIVEIFLFYIRRGDSSVIVKHSLQHNMLIQFNTLEAFMVTCLFGNTEIFGSDMRG